MKLLITFITLLVLIIYIKYDLKFNKHTQLLQFSSDKITQDILFEKYPIIIEDKINNMLDFIHKIISNEYFHKNNIKFNDIFKINKNLSTYLIIHNNNKIPINVYISNPSNKNKFRFIKSNSNNYSISNYNINNINNINDTQFIKIILHPKQSIILPKYWLFIIDKPTQLYSLFGFISYIVSIFIVLLN
jgi:hypothetical protein|tara:strand:- start:205 stop:771 length:567 start_codon:yes stop_codon:yes gene_type:complete